MFEWNEYDLLYMWERANGSLHPKWKKVFLNHQAVPEILKYPYDIVEMLMNWGTKTLDLILKDLNEFQVDMELEIYKESLLRTPVNNIDVEDANPEIISWDEDSYPPFL